MCVSFKAFVAFPSLLRSLKDVTTNGFGVLPSSILKRAEGGTLWLPAVGTTSRVHSLPAGGRSRKCPRCESLWVWGGVPCPAGKSGYGGAGPTAGAKQAVCAPPAPARVSSVALGRSLWGLLLGVPGNIRHPLLSLLTQAGLERAEGCGFMGDLWP